MNKSKTKTETLKKDIDSLPAPDGTTKPTTINYGELARTILSKIKPLHIVALVGVFAIFLGYISVAPPSELPSWPIYSLNARTWQSFERWVSIEKTLKIIVS